MEEDNLSVATTDTYLVIGYRLDGFDTLGTHRLRKNKHLVFDLEAAEISGASSHEKELFTWLGEGHAGVVSHHRAGLHRGVLASALSWVEGPKRELLGSADSKLVAGGISQLNVLDKTSPAEGSDSIGEDLRGHLERGDDVSVGGVPDEHLAIKLIAGGNQEAVVMREGEVRDGVVMLRQSEDGLLLIVVPDDNVRVVSLLSGGEQLAHVGDGDASDQIIVRCQEMLAVGIVQITCHYAATSDHYVLFRVGVQENRVINLSAEADGVVQLNH
jgi:hypothetical protein